MSQFRWGCYENFAAAQRARLTIDRQGPAAYRRRSFVSNREYGPLSPRRRLQNARQRLWPTRMRP